MAIVRCFILLPVLIAASLLPAHANKQLDAILEDHWVLVLSENPTFATQLGVRTYDDRLGSLTVASMDDATTARRGLVARLNDIADSELSEAERVNKRLLTTNLTQAIKSNSFGARLMPFSTYAGWHMGFPRLPENQPLRTLADYESYVARLVDFARFNAEGIATTRTGVQSGFILPCTILDGFDKTITAHIVDEVEASVFWAPFQAKPDSIEDDAWKNLKARGRAAIEEQVIAGYQALADFYTGEYLPNCAKEVGAGNLPDGAAYYAHRVAVETTTTLSPRQIHEIGLGEVKRIKDEMLAVMETTGFEGDFKAFQTFLRTDPQFYAKTPRELMERTAWISKRIDAELPKLFKRLPRIPYGVKPIPDAIAEKTTTAYYERPSGDGLRSGTYRVNTSKLNTRPLFEIEALTLHEAVPGHHLQLALQQELDLPMFRRFSGITAFVEGWGLYAERLGLEVGFYTDPYSNFGRLSYEMWRATRLVVDTGMHALGWSRERAVEFMADNTLLSLHNIDAEVDRYISWPGQALGYKLGELKIRELRTRAEKAFGDKFDIRTFHDEILKHGSLPLTLLEANIDAWIDKEASE
ncbi:MAG: DUF885 domain-containing protein [Pseudomonadota bacterium]